MSPWKVGVELELLAPHGLSRRDLAQAYARLIGGEIEPFFHPQSEPSLAKGIDVFENLTLGYKVFDGNGVWAGSFVDDLTLQADLNRNALPHPGWFRILSDDMRFLNLIKRIAPKPVDIASCLEPLANLFGTKLMASEHGIWQVQDESGASVALAAPLPGERHRPCEIVTPPLLESRRATLDRLLKLAVSMGFTLAKESATHVHYDAKVLQSAHATANLICFFHAYGGILKRLMGCNRYCRRLGEWPVALIQLVSDPHFRALSWAEARELLIDCHLKKYCDFNIKNYVLNLENKSTFEVRILPGILNTEELMSAIALFEGVLHYCIAPHIIGPKEPLSWGGATVDTMLSNLPITKELRGHWNRQAQLR